MQNICDEELNDDNNYPANIDWGVDYALTVYHTDGSVDNYSAGHLKQFGADQYGDDEGLLFGSQEAAQERIDAFRNSLLRMARPMMSTSTSLHSRRLHLPSSIRKQGRSKLLSVAVDKKQPTVD